jgi:hypothetical protein
MKRNKVLITLVVLSFLALGVVTVGQDREISLDWLDGRYLNTAGDTATGALDVSTAGLTLGHSASVYIDTASTSKNAETTRVPFDAELWDEDNEHDATTTKGRFTAGLDGKYAVEGAVAFSSNASGLRTVYVIVNANTSPDPSSTDQTYVGASIAGASKGLVALPFSVVVDLAATDYVEVFTLQSSGSDLTLLADSGSTLNCHANFRRVGE